MRRIYFILSVLFLLTLLHPWPSLAQKKCICSLTWAFIVAGVGGPDRVLDVTKQSVIYSGDQLRIVIDLETSQGYVYLFLLDSHGEFTILQGKKIEFPREGEWFTVDQSTGTDTFYLLASLYSLDSLAKAVRTYAEEPKSAEEKAAVLEEFEKARHSYTEPYVQERGVPIEGTIGEATRVKAAAFYAKIVQLRHE